MIPTDIWHTQMAEWRIQIVTQLESRYEGCDVH